ncbi:cobalamin-dependent protein [Jatrophihabitans endophyticus]|uniref:cobalamin-dependent protein n=1 Tax=Jatrophihabitans endophyticus TaxID=1206085 RepID=UPI00093438D8|nr:cobalamin-dependent protein [Jatrophihabitans endophyticus]
MAVSAHRLRIVVAHAGAEDQDRGATAMAHALRDAGTEVVYTGGGQTAAQIVRTVIQEDAAALGLAVPAAASLPAEIVTLLAEEGAEDVVVFVGADPAGVAGPADPGAAAVFVPGGADRDDVVDWIRRNLVSAEPG